MPGYDAWKTRAPEWNGPEEPSYEREKADYEDRIQQVGEKMRCEMCFDSKWKSACPECDGTGYYTLENAMTEKLKYWWSEDRQFFCIRIKGETVSLTVEEAEDLMGEVQQTPAFLKLQEEAWERAKQLMDERATEAHDHP